MQTEFLEFLMDTLVDHSNGSRKNTLVIGNPNPKTIQKFVNHSTKLHENNLNKIEKVEMFYLFVNDNYLHVYPSTRGLYKAILNQFLLAYDYSDNSIGLKKQIIYRVKKFNIKILIINDFHILLKNSDLKAKKILFALKKLADELDLSIVAIGNKEVLQYLNANTQCSNTFDILDLSQTLSLN